VADETYDFVIIGSGAGGGPVASNLALAGYTVLVLEAGEDQCGFNYRIPCFHPIASEDSTMSWDFFVRHYDDQSIQAKDSKFDAARDGILYPRAGTLGGCTAHNAMITVYPHSSDWSYIEELTGDPSWSPNNMRGYFERLEHCDYLSPWARLKEAIVGMLRHQGRNPSRHGFSGWLHTKTADPHLILKDKQLLKLITIAAVTGLKRHLGAFALELETLFDPNDWRAVSSMRREGVCLTPLATKSGERIGTRERLLQTVKDTNGRLHIKTGALASRIVFEGTRAVAVEYMEGRHLYRASKAPAADAQTVTKIVRANFEIILSGGAFNSPQLLMLSGIGDAKELSKFGIAPVVDLPGVGKNLQDRYEVGVISKMSKSFDLLRGASFVPPKPGEAPDQAFADWKKGKGVYTTNGAAIAITKRSTPDKYDPDLFIFGLPSHFKGYYPGYSDALQRYQNMFTWAVLKAHTNNTAGIVKLRSADPRDTPDICFRYFGEGNDTTQDDLNAVVEGVKFAREMNREIHEVVGMTEEWPGPNVVSDEEIANFVQREAWGHHASCTNPIGRAGDPAAVLDSRFRVYGTTGLRVVDASVFPRIPGYFIVTAIYMIAEKASEAILEDTKALQRSSSPMPSGVPMTPDPSAPSVAEAPHRRPLRTTLITLAILLATIVLAAFLAVLIFPLSSAGHVKDEAAQAGRGPETFPAAAEDYFHDMKDSVKPLTPDQIKGRNNWIVWTGGNDRFWDLISTKSFGALDLLKTISSHPSLKNNRDNRWSYLGLVNEPCFSKPTAADPGRYGLWLDVHNDDDKNCPPDPYADAKKYPGVKIGARGETVEVGSYYGYPTGVVGLRLFPNPAFDAEAKKRWDPVRYYTDRSYYEDRNLVRPYRVGMSCGFCHVGPNPVNPPADPNHPKWENLSSMVGAQYFWIDRIFAWEGDHSSFVFQLFHTSRPGALDTSLISTDNINNPRTMNAIYDLPSRLAMAQKWGQEKLAGGGLNNKQFNDFVPADNELARMFQAPDIVYTPHVLKDGADSVGALGALNRVYLNIGLFSEEWLEHFNALIGGKKTTPIEISVARKNSSYWVANEMQTIDLAKFMLVSTGAHHLADAPGGAAYLTKDKAVLTRGKEVFAERCARCHSSKLPESPDGVSLQGCAGKGYLDCWNRYWAWTSTDDFRKKMRDIVLRDDFLDNNFLSTDARVPLTLLRTNACSPLATNGLGGNIWDNFTSQSYKDLPSVGWIDVQDPYTGKATKYEMPAGGRGYTRVPSLISLWSTAPYLLNNTVGNNESLYRNGPSPNPSIEERMKSFNDGIHQMLWPETRTKDSLLPDTMAGLVDRTTERTWLRAGAGYLPEPLGNHIHIAHALLPWLFGRDGIEIGPIPAGTPVNLLANLNLMSDSTNSMERFQHNLRVARLVIHLKSDLKKLGDHPSDDDVRRIFAGVEPELISFNKCPDFVVNKGHYFGTDMLGQEPGLSDADKLALIEFLKTF
jgi:choline dehydrogenase-like flavoprotein